MRQGFAFQSWMTTAAVTLVALTTTAAACPTANPIKAEALTHGWYAAFRAGDAESLQRQYAADAVVAPFSRATPIATEPEMRGFLRAFVQTFEPLGPPMSAMRLGCHTILDFGTIVIKPRGGPTRAAFGVRYARVYERRGKKWMVVFESGAETRRLERPPMSQDPFAERPSPGRPPMSQDRLGRLLQRSGKPDPAGFNVPMPRPVAGRSRAVAGMIYRPPHIAPAPENNPPQRTDASASRKRRTGPTPSEKATLSSWARKAFQRD